MVLKTLEALAFELVFHFYSIKMLIAIAGF